MARQLIADIPFFDRHDAEFSESRTPKEKCIDGQPLQRTWNHFTSADEKFFAGTWEAEPGCWQISYTENEYCRIVSGRSILRDADGNETELKPGDEFVIPSGFEGQWEVIETTRKVYAIYEPGPDSAGG
ncbi:MAG: cupin domain-containing protein [Woeseiaceae bacterium]|nr:cupin domain-containing protein [Woeseiaceae bacterium]